MEYQVNREGWLFNDTHRQCTNCLEMFEKIGSDTMRICRPCNTARVKSNSAEYKMVARAKSRAKRRGMDFDLEVGDVVIPRKCPVLGIPIYVTSGRSGAFDNSPSLDRLDNSKGYIKGNVQVTSQLANAMKSSATPEQLRKFAEWVLRNY